MGDATQIAFTIGLCWHDTGDDSCGNDEPQSTVQSWWKRRLHCRRWCGHVEDLPRLELKGIQGQWSLFFACLAERRRAGAADLEPERQGPAVALVIAGSARDLVRELQP